MSEEQDGDVWVPDTEVKKAIDELSLPVGEPTTSAFSVTGEPYVSLCSGGIKQEGTEFPAFYPTQELARQAYRREFIEYAITAPNSSPETGHKVTLYWRCLPDMFHMVFYKPVHTKAGLKKERKVLYSVYSRLLISNKPRMEQFT